MASGWRYRGTTLENIPWTFAYMSSAHTLFGRVLTDETLLSELCAKQPELIVEDGKISVKPSQFCALSFCFIFHKQEFIDEMLKESIDFVISDRDRKTVCQKTIHFDDTYLTNIITSEKSNNYRNPRLIELARSILGD